MKYDKQFNSLYDPNHSFLYEISTNRIITGKTVILRKKAILVKEHIDSQGKYPNEAPRVYYVTLTSCDKFGRPELPVSFFDGATKRSFKKYDIQVITVHDLVVDFKEAFPNSDGKADIFPRSCGTDHEKDQRLTKIFEDCSNKYMADKTNKMDAWIFFYNTMDENGINSENAFREHLRRTKDPNYEKTLVDVYNLLFSFIQKHRKDHIFVDELSILHSKFCKLSLLSICLILLFITIIYYYIFIIQSL